jgi:hypothetical protein
MQEDSNATTPTQAEALLSALLGKFIVVHTLVGGHEAPARFGALQAGMLYGRLKSNYPDALVLEIVEREQPNGGTILVYKRAIVAIEARSTMTP